MKRKLLIYLAFSVIAVSSYSQSKYLRKGNWAYNEKTYNTAREYYQKVYDKARENQDNQTAGFACFKIAECYYKANNYERAIPFYNNAISLNYQDTSKIMYRNYGDMLMNVGDYAKAREMYKKQIALNGFDELSQTRLRSCFFVDTAKTYETIYDVINAQTINSRYSDFSPSPYREKVVLATSRFDADSIVYTYTGDGFEDLYETYYNLEQNTWSPISKLQGEINSTYNDGTFSFDQRTQTAYFMQCNGVSGAEKNCNIYTSKFNSESATWAKPQAFEYFTTEYSSGHPVITSDGLTLYFSSNNPAGIGGTDIWMCHKDSVNGKWSAPSNLGTMINTKGDEMFPYVNDNNGLYFSSNGHLGYGGLDMFYAPKNNQSFGEPINLRPPFNSSADDFSLMYLTENMGLFTSNRIGGVGNDDIYMFKLKDVKIVVTGRVINAADSLPIENAIILVKNSLTEAVDTLLTDSVGVYNYPAMQPNAQYKIFVYKSGYLNQDGKLVNTEGVRQSTCLDSLHGFDMNFVLQKIEKGKEYEIRDIYYDLDKYELRPMSVTQLQELVSILKNNPDICIQINSHTDERATDSYNNILSNNRAKAVVDYLTSQGIDKKRLTWKGWGETNLIYKNAESEEQHQANRRTTFTIMNFDQLQIAKQEKQERSEIERIERGGKPEPKESGIYFRLQVAASRARNNTIFASIGKDFPKLPTYCTQDSDGMYKYTVGSFATFQEANQMKDEIDKAGHHSFIISYENGKQIPINEALRKIQKLENK